MFHTALFLTLVLTGFASCGTTGRETELSSEEAGVDANECMVGRKVYSVNRTEKVAWFSAYITCRHDGLKLATFDTEEEYQRLVDTIKLDDDPAGDVGVWTAGYFDTEVNQYQWITRLTPMRYTIWREGRPTTAGHNCVELRRAQEFRMDDVSCVTENYVACHKEEKSWGPC